MLGNPLGTTLFYVGHCLCVMHSFEKVALLKEIVNHKEEVQLF